jgi:hypothetical protein
MLVRLFFGRAGLAGRHGDLAVVAVEGGLPGSVSG